jgi:uncharacterized protein
MKKYITLLIAVLATVFTANAFAFTPPDKPASGWYILDQANKLTEDQKTNLNKKIDGINKNTKNEFGVLIIQSMDGDNIEDVAQNTFRAWGVGKAGLNNGVLLVISVGDRKMRLQTGKGVEGDLPDLRAKDILDENLKPFLKKGDYYGGIDSTISAASSFLESRANAPVETVSNTSGATSKNSGVEWLIVLLFLGIFGGVGLISWLVSRSKRKREEESNRLYESSRIFALQQERARLQEAMFAKPYHIDNSFTSTHTSKTEISATAIGVGAVAAAAGIGGIAIATTAVSRAAEAKKRKAAEEREAEAVKRKKEEEDATARRRSEESSYSSYSSSDSGSSYSSYDSGSSSSYDSGGGFGGGDSGGDGGSSDF